MTETQSRIRNHFSNSIQIKINTADSLLNIITTAAEKMVQCLLDGNKILCCGEKKSAHLAFYFSSTLLHRHQQERPSLPVITLTPDLLAIHHDESTADSFTNQLRVLGNPGDLLLVICSDNEATNILSTIKTAQDKNIPIVALTGGDGGKIATFLQETDIEIRVPATEIERIQETHMLIVHCLCDSVDYQLFGHGEMIS